MLQTIRRTVGRLRSEERGASLVEYALLIALVLFVCIGALTFFGGASGNSTDTSASCIREAYAGRPPPAGC